MSLNPLTEVMQGLGLDCSPKCCGTYGVAAIVGLALFIIGCMGAAGTFPGSNIGWVTVGLAGGSFALNLAFGNFKQRKFQLLLGGLVAATLVTVGALGGVGILSVSQVGWGIIGSELVVMPFSCCATQRDVSNNGFNMVEYMVKQLTSQQPY